MYLRWASPHATRSKKKLIFVRENGEERIEQLDPDSSSSALFLAEQDAESLRQLYVALTRAKVRVYVPLAFDPSSSEIEKGEGSPTELFFAQEKTLDDACALFEGLR